MRANIVRIQENIFCLNELLIHLVEAYVNFCHVNGDCDGLNVFELGAHYGDCSLWVGQALSLVNVSWEIHAFEMQEDIAKSLQHGFLNSNEKTFFGFEKTFLQSSSVNIRFDCGGEAESF